MSIVSGAVGIAATLERYSILRKDRIGTIKRKPAAPRGRSPIFIKYIKALLSLSAFMVASTLLILINKRVRIVAKGPLFYVHAEDLSCVYLLLASQNMQIFFSKRFMPGLLLYRMLADSGGRCLPLPFRSHMLRAVLYNSRRCPA